MKLFSRELLNPGVSRREVFAWAMYDFANSGFATVVLTAVFNAYFVGVVAAGADWGTLAWTAALSASSVVVMLTMPLLGAHADRHRSKKKLLALSTAGCVAATLVLGLCGPGDVALAMIAVLVANVFFSWGESLIAAFLPELAHPQAMGRVSGWGWSFGYFGGMLTLGLSLVWVLKAQAAGETAQQFVPVTMVITAAVYAVAALLTFAWLGERGTVGAATDGGVKLADVWVQWRQSFLGALPYADFIQLMICSAAYQAGISVVIALAAVYAEQVLGFGTADTMILVFTVNIASAVGAFLFGYLQDARGHKRSLALTLWGWVLMTLLAAAAQGPALFWVAAGVAGLCMGTSQSAGRAMAASLSPAHRCGEFLGLWTLATRLASIIGPITYGMVTWLTDGDHRLAILVTGGFFLAGLLLLRPIDMARGLRVAQERLSD